MQEHLLTTGGGAYEVEKGEVPPLALRYPSAGIETSPFGRGQRGHDSGLCGRPPDSGEGSFFPGRSCPEIQSNRKWLPRGATWQVAQRLELLPLEQASVTSREETTTYWWRPPGWQQHWIHGRNPKQLPVIYIFWIIAINYLSSDVGFLPSTGLDSFHHEKSTNV